MPRQLFTSPTNHKTGATPQLQEPAEKPKPPDPQSKGVKKKKNGLNKAKKNQDSILTHFAESPTKSKNTASSRAGKGRSRPTVSPPDKMPGKNLLPLPLCALCPGTRKGEGVMEQATCGICSGVSSFCCGRQECHGPARTDHCPHCNKPWKVFASPNSAATPHKKRRNEGNDDAPAPANPPTDRTLSSSSSTPTPQQNKIQ